MEPPKRLLFRLLGHQAGPGRWEHDPLADLPMSRIGPALSEGRNGPTGWST